MIAIAAALVAMIAFTILFLSGALAPPESRADARLSIGIVGLTISVIALGGAVVAVLP